MKESFGKVLKILLAVFLVSCTSKTNQQTKIRIVDLGGKPHPVHTITPELNLQAMAEQGQIPKSTTSFDNQIPQNHNLSNEQSPEEYGAFSSAMVQKTFQPKQQTEQSQQQIASEKSSANNLNDSKLSVENANAEDIPELDLTEKKEAKKAENKPTLNKETTSHSEKKTIVSSKKQKGIFVQVGSFSMLRNAKQHLEDMQKFHSGRVEIIKNNKTIYRVLLGPFTNKAKANQMVKKITDSGREAIIVRNR